MKIKAVVLAMVVGLALVMAPSAHAVGLCADLFAPRPAATASRGALRRLETVSQIKVMAFNVEEFFLTVHDGREAKSVEAIRGVARAITDANPDFLVLEEVGGIDALKTLSRTYLNDAYEAFLVPGNDMGGIDIGYLVKRDLPLSVSVESHRDVMWKDPVDQAQHKLFTRDAPALMIRAAGAAENSAPLFILIGNHAKAQRDRDGDPESVLLRTAQYKAMASIVNDYQTEFGREVPIIVGGDFNADVQSAPSIAALRKNMKDPFDLTGATKAARVTHTYHPREGDAEYSQLDALLVTPSLADNVVSMETYRYKNRQGVAKPLPTTYDERSENPSDHFPIILVLKTDDLFPRAAGQ